MVSLDHGHAKRVAKGRKSMKTVPKSTENSTDLHLGLLGPQGHSAQRYETSQNAIIRCGRERSVGARNVELDGAPGRESGVKRGILRQMRIGWTVGYGDSIIPRMAQST